jgi:hypothetical protein
VRRQKPFMHTEFTVVHPESGRQVCPYPGHLRRTTHVCPLGQPLVAQSLGPVSPAPQKPLPARVSKHLHSVVPGQLITPVSVPEAHVAAQWQSPLESGTAFFLRHLHLALHLCLASASRGNREGTTAPRSAPPASLSARLLEIVPSSSPLARSSKKCSCIATSLSTLDTPRYRDCRHRYLQRISYPGHNQSFSCNRRYRCLSHKSLGRLDPCSTYSSYCRGKKTGPGRVRIAMRSGNHPAPAGCHPACGTCGEPCGQEPPHVRASRASGQRPEQQHQTA